MASDNRAHQTPVFSLAVLAGLALASLWASGCSPRKKLVEWGWDEPDTAFLRANIREMEKAPFDGCVFGVRHGPGGRGGSFTWEFWGRRRFAPSDLVDAFADLRATRPRRFRETFLRVNVTPVDLDWFDDFSSVAANARLAAELARAGRARGILLDVEQYQGPLFDYRMQRRASSRSWDDYASRARMRGREIMAAFQDGYPGLTVFLTFGYTLPWVLSDQGRRPLPGTPYGLLAPFLDGMVDAARARTRLVDGYELSYGFKETGQFADARRLFETGVLPIVASPDKYRGRTQLAFGVWLDYDWRHHTWAPDDVARNYFTPDAFEAVVSDALRSSDEYVWIYSETPRWWGASDGRTQMPDAYRTAILCARSDCNRSAAERAGIRYRAASPK